MNLLAYNKLLNLKLVFVLLNKAYYMLIRNKTNTDNHLAYCAIQAWNKREVRGNEY